MSRAAAPRPLRPGESNGSRTEEVAIDVRTGSGTTPHGVDRLCRTLRREGHSRMARRIRARARLAGRLDRTRERRQVAADMAALFGGVA